MKTKLILLALLSTFSLQPSALHAQGSLTPPGAPGPTMKSLDQIEARTAITNTASLVTISQPGSYYLTHNLTISTGDGIDINTNGVTLDLNGFTISSTAASATGTGILFNGTLRNITIANGFIQGGVTNNGSGVYSGSGFGYGIYYSGGAPGNVLVSRISVSGCLYYGIFLNTGDSTVVESCTVRTVGSYGIYASISKSSLAIDCGSTAIYGDLVSDCLGSSSGGVGLYASYSAIGCSGGSSSGIGLSSTATAQNCFGVSSSNTGLFAKTALNCYGTSGSSTGLYATCSATDCYGHSNSGTGLYAKVANTCVGDRASGTAIQATIGIGCYANTGTNIINYKYNMP